MELHKAIKEIVEREGAGMINNIKIINFLLDYQAFKEKPATKLIMRDIINAGYAEDIVALVSTREWELKLKKIESEFIDSCGYKEDLARYVFDSMAYGLGLGKSNEPSINRQINVDSFFEIPDIEEGKKEESPEQITQDNKDSQDYYTIASSFYHEGKYDLAKSFIEKAISLCVIKAPSSSLKLLADILTKLDKYDDAISTYDQCFQNKAMESNISISQLRDALMKHEISGFENSMFFYYLCLFCSNKITDAQWKHILKGECLYGLYEAVQYCASVGIDPVDEHFNIYFTDRSQLKTGDFLYHDGSFSHELSRTKQKIGTIVFSETSQYERSHGWTHGYILGEQIKYLSKNSVPVMIKCDFQWSSVNEDLKFPHSHFTEDDLHHWEEINKIESGHFIDTSLLDLQKYPVFNEVNKLKKLPLNIASDWFVPSIHTFKRIQTSIRKMGLKEALGLYSKAINTWTSSQSSRNQAIAAYGSISNVHFCVNDKSSNNKIIPVAAF